MSAALTAWHREQAAKVAAAYPLCPNAPIRAKGEHLLSANDEPELPDSKPFTEARARIEAEAIERTRAVLAARRGK